jgi:hypothetical protein
LKQKDTSDFVAKNIDSIKSILTECAETLRSEQPISKELSNSIDYVYSELKKSGKEIDLAILELIDPIITLIRGDLVENLLYNQMIDIDGKITNPLINLVDIDDVVFEDTVVIREKGSLKEGVIIKITDASTLDNLRNFTDFNKYDVYKWSGRPRNLVAGDTQLEIEVYKGDVKTTTKISHFQTDVGRALFYFVSHEGENETMIDGKQELLITTLIRILEHRTTPDQDIIN